MLALWLKGGGWLLNWMDVDATTAFETVVPELPTTVYVLRRLAICTLLLALGTGFCDLLRFVYGLLRSALRGR
jgi:hypothetical protein